MVRPIPSAESDAVWSGMRRRCFHTLPPTSLGWRGAAPERRAAVAANWLRYLYTGSGVLPVGFAGFAELVTHRAGVCGTKLSFLLNHLFLTFQCGSLLVLIVITTRPIHFARPSYLGWSRGRIVLEAITADPTPKPMEHPVDARCRYTHIFISSLRLPHELLA